MTTDDLARLFTKEALLLFQPRPGSRGLDPCLEVRTPTDIAVFILALADYNDWEARQGYMYTLGKRCAVHHPGVEVVRFGSEAWFKGFTPEEFRARRGRTVESYDDKEEIILVFGQLSSGPTYLARAVLKRRASGRVKSIGTWEILKDSPDTRVNAYLLGAFWRGYRAGKAPTN